MMINISRLRMGKKLDQLGRRKKTAAFVFSAKSSRFFTQSPARLHGLAKANGFVPVSVALAFSIAFSLSSVSPLWDFQA